MLAVLSVALPRRSVVPWAARTVITSGTVLLSSSNRCTNTGMVTLRVMLEAALVRVQKLALRPLVALLARSDCVRLAHRHRLVLLAALIHLSTTGWCSTAAGLTLTCRGVRRRLPCRVLQSPRRFRCWRTLLQLLILLPLVDERLAWILGVLHRRRNIDADSHRLRAILPRLQSQAAVLRQQRN